MKYRIDEKEGEIDIQINETDSTDAQLLAAFQRCREGRCDCPTEEYKKVKGMRMEKGTHGISLRLDVKPGQSISQKAVAKCLDHTLRGKKEEDGPSRELI